MIFDFGVKERGECAGMSSQADVVDAYGVRLNEELEYENVRTNYIDTRKSPFWTTDEGIGETPANFLPLVISCGWRTRNHPANGSVVEFAGDHYYRLAEALCFTLNEWGKAYVFGHRGGRPVALELVNGKGFIRVKPFALNGPNADEYMKRLDKLGEDIGRAVGEYLASRGEGLRR